MKKNRTPIVSLAVGIPVLIVVSIIIYSALFWFVELPVTNSKTENKISEYCEKIKCIDEFSDLKSHAPQK